LNESYSMDIVRNILIQKFALDITNIIIDELYINIWKNRFNQSLLDIKKSFRIKHSIVARQRQKFNRCRRLLGRRVNFSNRPLMYSGIQIVNMNSILQKN
jgi:hypothetical protein